ncbi:MAG: hypothetical protein OEM02_15640 [Desulfobulbaceae bacterium]|nr:hypothetical protein [Desulfobulbaceae bacterium]
MLKIIVKYIFITVFSVLVAEGMLNFVCSPTILMSKWFTGNIHTPDGLFGFKMTPYYDGWMRHEDDPFLKRLTLDANGFRNPAINSISKQDIVLIGGYSMMFGYGVEDVDSVHFQVQKNLDQPANVYNTAWPGFDSRRNLKVYQDKLEDHISPQLIIISFWGETLESFSDYDDISKESKITQQDVDELFFYDRNHVLRRPVGGVAQMSGYLYFNSMVVHGFSNMLDNLYSKRLKIKDKVVGINLFDSRLFVNTKAGMRRDGNADSLGAVKFQHYVKLLQNYFKDQNQKVLFVFLPKEGVRKGYYDELVALLSNSSDYIDVNAQLHKKIWKTKFIAKGHYSEKHCELIGKSIAVKINEMQKSQFTCSVR